MLPFNLDLHNKIASRDGLTILNAHVVVNDDCARVSVALAVGSRKLNYDTYKLHFIIDKKAEVPIGIINDTLVKDGTLSYLQVEILQNILRLEIVRYVRHRIALKLTHPEKA